MDAELEPDEGSRAGRDHSGDRGRLRESLLVFML